MVVATVASSTSVCGTLESGSTLSWTIGCPPTKENLSSSTPPMPTSSGAHSWKRHTQSKSHPHPHTITHTLLPHSHILTLYPHTITSYTSTLILTLSLHILCTLTPSHSHPYPHTLTLTSLPSHPHTHTCILTFCVCGEVWLVSLHSYTTEPFPLLSQTLWRL